MAVQARQLDLGSLRLSAGEGRRLELELADPVLVLGGERYRAQLDELPATLDISRMTAGGYALRLRLSGSLHGPCMRCLQPAAPEIEIDAREVAVPGAGEELESPYVQDDTLDLEAWAQDAFALAAPAKVLCRADCAGLCPECAADLNEAGPGHSHPRAPDARWAKLGELELELE
ncbi:MAG TPA: DUF177 domain-containing protein [Solirubrobacteraceae bacterium]|nr:DUF177 domain-containing protein [Solirubrobacteraceae bacterium]